MSIQRLPRLDVKRLAADYSAAIRREHSSLELDNIRRRNAAESDPNIDHAHDYTDANDMMAEAVSLQLGTGWDWAEISHDANIAAARARRGSFRLSRILIACEWSGTVRDEFAAQGHDVMSCDILDTATPGQHYRGDVRDVMGDGWHMMIAFPPCTFLCNSGVKHLVRGGQRIDPPRWDSMREGAEFFRDLGTAPIEKIARENPIMHKYAVEIIGSRADQFVQVHHYGDDASKRTGFHLQNLDKLVDDPKDHVAPRIIEYPRGSGKMVKRWANQSPCGADKTGPSADRGQKRGKTYPGIAKAMAATWGGLKALTQVTTPNPITQMELFI